MESPGDSRAVDQPGNRSCFTGNPLDPAGYQVECRQVKRFHKVPDPAICSLVSSNLFVFRPANMTLAFKELSKTAIIRPIPEEAPVTKTVAPSISSGLDGKPSRGSTPLILQPPSEHTPVRTPEKVLQVQRLRENIVKPINYLQETPANNGRSV